MSQRPRAQLSPQRESCPAASPSPSTMNDTNTNNCVAINLCPFAFGLFSVLAQNSTENVLLSPYSIAAALAIAFAGVTLESLSEEQLGSVLGISSHADLPLLSQAILDSAASTQDTVIQFTSANGIWIRDSIIKPGYVETVTQTHKGTADTLKATYDPINSYVSQNTKGLISNFFEDGAVVDPLTVAVLINAVHFKGHWRVKFDRNLTQTGTFQMANGVERECKFMMATRQMMVVPRVKGLAGASLLRLEYGPEANKGEGERGRETDEAEFSALFVLPSDPNSMEAVLSSLNQMHQVDSNITLNHLMTQLKPRRVELSLPRFKVEYGTTSLKPHLQTLGLTAPFDPSLTSQFLTLSEDPLVYLSDVLHKAVLEVNEEGTEAAAATAGIMKTRSLPPPPFEMRFDRPFVMMVVHVPTGTPLFVGKMEDPEFLM
eukprot:scaffold21358_cov46-Attheya_sp.AAC.5